MAGQLIWSPTARLDLQEIFSYIAGNDADAARRFMLGLFDVVEGLPSFRESGRIVPELDDPMIREIIRRPCRIVYRLKPDDKTIEIARVWHAARGIPEI